MSAERNMPLDFNNAMAHCRIIIPMKPLPQAKSRLREHLPSSVCDALVLFMLERVLAAVQPRNERWWSCIVAGGDEPIRRVAEASGADWTPEPASGLNEAVRSAMKAAYAEGEDAAVYLPGDLPLIKDHDVFEIIYAGRMLKRPVGVPAAVGGGTNALLIPAGMQMELHFGEGSYAKHRESAKRAGARIRTLKVPGVMRDIDTEVDYQWLLLNVPGTVDMVMNWQEWLHRGIASPPPMEAMMKRQPDEQER